MWEQLHTHPILRERKNVETVWGFLFPIQDFHQWRVHATRDEQKQEEKQRGRMLYSLFRPRRSFGSLAGTPDGVAVDRPPGFRFSPSLGMEWAGSVVWPMPFFALGASTSAPVLGSRGEEWRWLAWAEAANGCRPLRGGVNELDEPGALASWDVELKRGLKKHEPNVWVPRQRPYATAELRLTMRLGEFYHLRRGVWRLIDQLLQIQHQESQTPPADWSCVHESRSIIEPDQNIRRTSPTTIDQLLHQEQIRDSDRWVNTSPLSQSQWAYVERSNPSWACSHRFRHADRRWGERSW